MEILHTKGHSDDEHLSVLLNKNFLIAGDVIEVDMNVNGESKNNLIKLVNTLETLNKTPYKIIIPGHGSIGAGNGILKQTLKNVKVEIKKLEANSFNSTTIDFI